MKKIPPKFVLMAAGLLLVGLFFFPLWRITLLAPQYPDGVHMLIYINKIGGTEPGTLQNVNILNHYIGMKPIEPDAIPELKILPVIIMAFIGTAIFFALLNNKYIYLFWQVALIIGCVVALYDFYLWEYDYGHDLDPNAPMSFEGESFQPPLLGRKNIINFTAISMPHIGGYLTFFALLLASYASYLKFHE